MPRLGIGALFVLALTSFAGSKPAWALDLVEASIADIQAEIASGELDSESLVAGYLARIEAYDRAGPRLNAIAAIAPDAQAQARALDAERVRSGPRGPLHGIAVVVKDNYGTVDMETTAGSIALAGYVPSTDAFLVAKLRAAGAIILAKTNMHAFAFGWEGIGSGFGQVRNPYALDHGAGGSSSGTAAAIAASFATVGLGTDTCGSVRLPAAYSNLVGLRPTQGLLSTSGIIPLSASLDTPGPIARNVTDIALTLDALAGYDPADPETAAGIDNLPPSYLDALDREGLRGSRIGVLTSYRRENADPDVMASFDAALTSLGNQGAALVDVTMPDWKRLFFAPDPYYLIFQEVRHSLDSYLAAHPEAPVQSLAEIVASGKLSEHGSVLPRLKSAAGTDGFRSAQYYENLARRAEIRTAVLALMAEYQLDALTYPTASGKPPLLGANENGGLVNCYLSAHSGLPAITVPAGLTPDGYPAGIEFLARPWHEALLLGIAFAYEQATRHRVSPKSTPPLQDR